MKKILSLVALFTIAAGYVSATDVPNSRTYDYKGNSFKMDTVILTSNTMTGTVTVNGTTPVSASNVNISTGDIVVMSLNTPAGTVGAKPVITSVQADVGFTVKATASDTSTYNYAILKIK